MTNEEAIKNLAIVKNLEDALGNFDGGIKNSDLSKSLAMAIKALGHQPCDDCIRRQQAIDAVKERYYKYGRFAKIEELVWSIEKLPSAQPEPCKDTVSRNAIIQKLNTMNRYVSEELRLCDTDKKFPKNEVFIVDDVYEEIAENLPSAQPKIGKWILSGGYWRCSECREKALLKLDKAKGGHREYEPVRSKHCPSCGTKMEGVKE